MLSKDNEIKLIDFGLSTVSTRTNSQRVMAGTNQYMAPEVFKFDYGTPCDIWSLGVCLYYLLTGKKPFNGRGIQAL